jgi:FdhE protein
MIPAASSQALLTALDLEHPEWRPLLAVVEEAMREAQRSRWARVVSALGHSGNDGRPLLDGAVITVIPGVVGRWVRRILRIAAAAGTEVRPLATAVAARRIHALVLFETAVAQDGPRLDDLARAHGDDHGVLRGLAPLIAWPMLQACRRAWAGRVPETWPHGYCPICGGWPALAEIRGLGGHRHLRCGACGGDWRTQWLRCSFCGQDDHDQLGSLASAESLDRETIAVCDGCNGYLKTITTLAPIGPEHVMLQDLGSLVLDVVALERGYRRPAASGRGVAVSVVATPSRLRDLLGLRP